MRGELMNDRANARGGRWLGPVLAAGVLIVGLAVTGLAVDTLRAGDRDGARRVMDQRTAVARSAVTVETSRYLDLLRTMAAGAGTDDHLTAADFRAATAPLNAADLVGATSVIFAVASAPDDIAADQALWRSRGATDLTFDPRGQADEHAFSVFSRVLNGNAPVAAGIDISVSPEATAAMQEARRTGAPTVSDTYVLLSDRDLPAERQQLSFAFVAPVYAESDEPGELPEFRGWIIMGLHGQDFLGGVIGKASQGLLDGELRATNGDGRQVQVAAYTTGGTPDLRRQATFPVADRHWTLITGADSANLPGARSDLPVTVMLGGVAITVILAGLVQVLATGRARARGQVLVATAELREAEAEARRQAGLLSAIMASISDGVSVVDGTGEVLSHNPAAKALLGVHGDVNGPDLWQEHYGLFLPDGRTPFPVGEMPLVRGLRGESSDGVEMIVRNANRPDGILVSIDGRPLDASAGQHGAVAVVHDITEVRRYEADLAVFAGVVAHDLKAPLSVIWGHCETAADALGDDAGTDSVDEARSALNRIALAVDRMAALIDTLLAYTTSRDAPLHLDVVPLGSLIADAVSERTGHRRPTDGPSPDIYVGPMPDVVVDPAMLRHVIDNLIGNALKYVQPGRGARVDVTAGPSAPGWVRVEVADRGIGIPDDDKPDIFESFHRAQSAVGYAGTGLGLAICRRIVERHGGAIGVKDNLGGGTRFHFTLPVPAPGPVPVATAGSSRPTMPTSPTPDPAAPDPAAPVAVGAGASELTRSGVLVAGPPDVAASDPAVAARAVDDHCGTADVQAAAVPDPAVSTAADAARPAAGSPARGPRIEPDEPLASPTRSRESSAAPALDRALAERAEVQRSEVQRSAPPRSAATPSPSVRRLTVRSAVPTHAPTPQNKA
jgi:signal transduction histidine kinase/CHASE1-domain containing sensor protein